MTNFSSDVPLSSVKVRAQKGSTLHRLVLFPLLANSAMKDTERYGRLNLVLHCFILYYQIVVMDLPVFTIPSDCHLSVVSNRNEVEIAETALEYWYS